MQIIILAAGKGSRLGNLNHPKALTPLNNGETILSRQIRLLQSLIPNNPIHIVVGYRKELIAQQFHHLNLINSDNYASENTSKSLLLAINPQLGDVLWLNGDVVFHPHALEKILETGPTSMLVNKGPVADEEIKYSLNNNGEITEASKTVQNPVGEAVGINFFSQHDSILLKQALQNCQPNDYFEKAIESCIQKKMKILPATIPQNLCIEIDFPQDLLTANNLITQWVQES